MANPPQFETTLQKIFRKSKEQPWVPLGVCLTVGAFVGAYTKFRKGSKQEGIKFLRYRVAFQSLTVVGLLLGTLLTTTSNLDNHKLPPIKPVSNFKVVEE